jgi:hypothetical protein
MYPLEVPRIRMGSAVNVPYFDFPFPYLTGDS